MRFLVTAVRGTERILYEELVELGLAPTLIVPGGVVFDGDITAGMRACLWLRTGQRVLTLIGRDDVRSAPQLYDAVRRLPLLDWFTPDHSIAVHFNGGQAIFRDNRYAALVTKDAIVDAVRDRYGRRPDVDKERPALDVVAMVEDTTVRFFVGLNGDPLAFRGYRRYDVEAPIRESLAAALIRYSEWDRKSPFWDPFCGSGTLAIEAGMMATNTAPGLFRSFGFERWPFFAELASAWSALTDEARQKRVERYRGLLIASDIDRKAVESTRKNLAAAELFHSVTVRECDALQVTPFRESGFFVSNPPYGDRIGGGPQAAAELLARYADLVGGFASHTWALVGERRLLDEAIERRPKKSLGTFNGPIATRFVVFQNRKPRPTEEPSPPEPAPAPGQP
jgi:putative N6-adenine-specific DNA methylase